jgi:hypothetical protein
MEENRNGTRPALSSELTLKLRRLGRSVSPTEISDLWVFPPIEALEDSSEFFLFTRFLTADIRRLCAARFVCVRNGGLESHLEQEVTEYGSVPAQRIPRLIEGFRKRLGDGRPPIHLTIDGCPVSWDRLVSLESGV